MTSPSKYFSQCKESASLFTRLQLMRVKAARWTKVHHGNLLLKTSPAKPVIALIIHPCVIQGQLTLVHARDLASADTEYYQKLCQFAEAESYVLLPDRRYKDSDVEFDRQGWVVACYGTNSWASDGHSGGERNL